MHSRISELPTEILFKIIQEVDPRAKEALWSKTPGFKKFLLFSKNDADLKSSNQLTVVDRFFRTLLDPAHLAAMGEKLINFAINGQQDEVIATLTKFPELISLKLSFADLSGRFFENVSIYQYAHWALDRHLWLAIDEVVTDPDLAHELNQQLIDLKDKGIYYRYQEKDYTETHYDLDLFINALYDYIHQRDDFSVDECIENWAKKIGQIQIGFPASVVNELCQSIKFEPKPDFKLQPLERRRKFYFKENAVKGDQYDWYLSRDGYQIGENFAVLKTLEGATALAAPTKTLDIIALKTNMDAMEALKNVRVSEYKERLAKAIHQNSNEVLSQLPRALKV